VSEPVLILGASGGIGSAVARRLAGAGHSVILHGRHHGRLTQLATTIGSTAFVNAADLSDEHEVEALFSGIRATHGRLGGLVFSIATPFPRKLAHRIPWAVFEEQIATQLKALHLSASAALPLLSHSGMTTRFVVISTEAVLGAPPIKTAPYVAAKAAITAYAQVIAQEWLNRDIRVHIIAPGLVKTALVADMPDEFLDNVAEKMPEGRLTSAEDVAAMVAFLMTEMADPLYGMPIRFSRAERK
jgi:3-oxoacyl-[acyl-carrier protein] reductase